MSDTATLFHQFFPENFILETPRVILRPLQSGDQELLQPLTTSGDTWKYFNKNLGEPGEFENWMKAAIEEKQSFKRMPFLVFDKDAKLPAGSTSYGNFSFYDKRLEIGWSWLGTDFLGMGVNKHAKFALLSYAFEVMQMERVEVKTDVLNERAKAALLKVGLIPEGVLRSHTLMHSNRRRDTIYFGLLKNEWAERKQSFFAELC